ncbi:phytase-like protein with esterase activity [Sphaerotilus hippei]|uniref:Phytase-like protein with esterase activity n=1 Tax=Sphaerotilus hippei TaxID=744406 RepID=A0A318H3Z0_9BURK|nr:esterase-like activity of phytase family protein [Sphaerotilus hippei]PXW98180.1 phytase-like protein with esterase activity [Sphaerotilus hippei]
MNKQRSRIALAALATLLGLSGCMGSDDDGPAVVTGSFLDSAVQGLSYRALPSGRSGTTDAQGQFQCVAGDRVSFALGGVQLGTAACGSTLTPLDLAGSSTLTEVAVANRLLFLQVLDTDDQAVNGLRIDAAVATALAGSSLDFSLDAGAFDAALAALLPGTVRDDFGQAYSRRTLTLRRAAALEHFEGTLAGALGRTGTSATSQATAAGEVLITKHTLLASAAQHVSYEGSNAAAKLDFPLGFFPAVGSGLAFKGTAADGSLEFWGITDRGPNGDSPNAPTPADTSKVGITKMFPAPSFTPSIGVISVGRGGAVLQSLLPLKSDATTKISGRPLPVGAVGNSGETALNDELKHVASQVGFDAHGLDSESLVHDAARGAFWTSDEYGPFIVRIDAATGVIQKRYAPGTGATDLPAVLAHRRANRGMEGLTMDAASGRLHGFLQSPIDPLDSTGKSVETTDTSDMDQDGKTTDKVKLRDFAQFARWIEFDPATETSRLYAYPLGHALAASGGAWDRNRTGSAKLGDVVSLGNGRFVVIEQGADKAGVVRNFLMLVEVPADVTDIAGLGIELEKNSIDGTTASATTWARVVRLRKTVLLDLNAAGWSAEKAEGLTLVDGRTLALINDNDFGLRSVLVDASGAFVDGDPTACTVDVNGAIVADGACATGAVGVRVTRGSDAERATRLWLLKFPKALASYTLP